MNEIVIPKSAQEILDTKGKVIVKFGADWCGPCGSLDGKLKTFEFENKENVTIFKVDVENNGNVVQEMMEKRLIGMIRSIPITYVFEDGKKILENEVLVGDQILEKINSEFKN